MHIVDTLNVYLISFISYNCVSICLTWQMIKNNIIRLSWKIVVNLRIRRGKLCTNILMKHLQHCTKCIRSSYDKNFTKFNKTTPVNT